MGVVEMARTARKIGIFILEITHRSLGITLRGILFHTSQHELGARALSHPASSNYY